MREGAGTFAHGTFVSWDKCSIYGNVSYPPDRVWYRVRTTVVFRLWDECSVERMFHKS